MQAFGEDPKQGVKEEKLPLRKQDLNANGRADSIRARKEAGKVLETKAPPLSSRGLSGGSPWRQFLGGRSPQCSARLPETRLLLSSCP